MDQIHDYWLPNLPTGWHVDQAIVDDASSNSLVVIRFGNHNNIDCMVQDEVLRGVAEKVQSFAIIYKCDNTVVRDFDVMYELYDPMTVMFFFRNKHMMCDFGTGNNNKMNFLLENKEEMIDIITEIYRGARKGKGLVVSPKDYSTRHRY